MPIDRHSHPPALKLVAGAAVEQPSLAFAGRDWSQLMTRAQDGDRDAYRTLLQDVTSYLRAMASRYFKGQSDIEDAVQDVLLTLHSIRYTYDPARPFGPWLVAIANRRFIDRLRRETRIRAREIELSAEHETFPDAATNFERQSTDNADLTVAIEQLPPDQQQAVRLLKLRELSLKEASAVSGRSVAALKTATHRAMKSLRRLLNQPGAQP